jgi:hypothetical protein
VIKKRLSAYTTHKSREDWKARDSPHPLPLVGRIASNAGKAAAPLQHCLQPDCRTARRPLKVGE